MIDSAFVHFVPFWGLFLLTITVVALSIEAGYRLGQYRRRYWGDEKENPVGSIIAATLGLLAFVLAFTFGMVSTRFDARRHIVVAEANAIGTTYLRAGFLPDNRGNKCRKLLKEYVDARLEVIRTHDAETLFRRSDQIHHELWKEAEAVGMEYPDSIVVGLYVQSLNEVIDTHSERRFIAFENALPNVFWIVLYLITFLTMAGVGYYEGLVKSNRSLMLIVLILAFSAVIMLITDLDSPQTGFLTVSQQSMIELQKTIEASN